MSPNSVLIIGSSSGIGIELVKKWTKCEETPEHIFGTYNDQDTHEELLSLAKNDARIHPLKVEATDYSQHADFAEKIREILGEDEKGLNLIIISSNFSDIPLEKVYRTKEAEFVKCAVAKIELAKSLLPLIKKEAPKDGNMSVNQAAIVRVTTSFAAGQMNGPEPGEGLYTQTTPEGAQYTIIMHNAMQKLSADLHGQGILVMSLHPRLVPSSPSSTAEEAMEKSIKSMLDVMSSATSQDYGSDKRYDLGPCEGEDKVEADQRDTATPRRPLWSRLCGCFGTLDSSPANTGERQPAYVYVVSSKPPEEVFRTGLP